MSYKPVCGLPCAAGRLPDGRERIVCMAGGMLSGEFVYDPNDPASKDAALRAFDEYGIGLRAAIEKNLGRRLTANEIFRGVGHVEDEDPITRAQVKAERDALFAPPADPRNWAEKRLDEHKAAKKRDRDPKGAFLEEQVERLAAQERAAKEKAHRDADPRRQHCIQDAQATKLAAIFDSTIPLSELRAADHRLRIAKEGSVKVYADEKNQFQRRQEKRLLERSAPAMEQIANANERLRQLRTPFALPAATIEYEPGKPIDLVEEGKRLGIDTSGLFTPAAQPQQQ
jgi:hypothetical protein